MEKIAAGKYSTATAYIEYDAMTKTWLVYTDGSGIPTRACKTLKEAKQY